jgi:hypothetical protein
LDGIVSKFNDLLFELRCWDTDRLRVERERVIVERRKLRTRELGLTLEHLPNLGNAAMDGELSSGQLDPASDLADRDSDADVTERAKHTSPFDLQRMAQRAKPRREDSVARRNRRSLRKWRDDDGHLCGNFALPLEHGRAIVESFFDQVTQRMRPQTGEAWEPLERRQADVLIGLCQLEADEAAGSGRDEEDRATDATLGARVDVHVHIPLDGPATMCGVPLPTSGSTRRVRTPGCISGSWTSTATWSTMTGRGRSCPRNADARS